MIACEKKTFVLNNARWSYKPTSAESVQARFGMAMLRVVKGSEAVLGAASNMWPVFSTTLQ